MGAGWENPTIKTKVGLSIPEWEPLSRLTIADDRCGPKCRKGKLRPRDGKAKPQVTQQQGEARPQTPDSQLCALPIPNPTFL